MALGETLGGGVLGKVAIGGVRVLHWERDKCVVLPAPSLCSAVAWKGLLWTVGPLFWPPLKVG